MVQTRSHCETHPEIKTLNSVCFPAYETLAPRVGKKKFKKEEKLRYYTNFFIVVVEYESLDGTMKVKLLGNFLCLKRAASQRMILEGFSNVDECSAVKSLRNDYLRVDGKTRDKKSAEEFLSNDWSSSALLAIHKLADIVTFLPFSVSTWKVKSFLDIPTFSGMRAGENKISKLFFSATYSMGNANRGPRFTWMFVFPPNKNLLRKFFSFSLSSHLWLCLTASLKRVCRVMSQDFYLPSQRWFEGSFHDSKSRSFHCDTCFASSFETENFCSKLDGNC